jgi:hypothetical protein
MKTGFWLIIFAFYLPAVYGQKKGEEKKHYVCSLLASADMFHDQSNCAGLQMCGGGRIRTTRNVDKLKPCPKCASPVYKSKDFVDIKRILGVKDKKQIKDSLGTNESTIGRPNGVTVRISGPPQSRTVNTLEFFLSDPVLFSEDSLFSSAFYHRLGLQFDGCRSDTVRNNQPHPVTGKVKKDVSVEYRGCAIVEAKDSYEDKSRYFYELTFFAKETDRDTYLDKVQLLLKVE